MNYSMRKGYIDRGLSSYQIKLIAVIFMTLGNLAAYGEEIELVSDHSMILSILGQISLPLFLYMLTESIHHTRNKQHFLFRLYFAAIGVGLLTTLSNIYTGDSVGFYRQDNIIFTYFYIALYIISIERIINGSQSHIKTETVFGTIGIITSIIAHLIVVFIRPALVDNIYSAAWFDSFIESPLYVEYTSIVIILGVLIYFLKEKWQKALVVCLFSFLSSSDMLEGFFISTPVSTFFNYPRHFMILGVPFMLLYNGTRGKENKSFFYLYYPIHRYCIALIAFTVNALV